MPFKPSIISSAITLACCLSMASVNCTAFASPWPPSPAVPQIPIWPGTPPNANVGPKPDAETLKDGIARNVSRPTMTVYSPEGKNTGSAVVVFPGGGYQVLAMELEGTEVCDWLTSKGITAVLLKYRVPKTGHYWDNAAGRHLMPRAPMALQDAQRTVGLLRHNAAKYKIDPHKIGVLGFSAGGHLSTDVSTHFKKRAYPPIDAADKVSCRPDFSVVLYPGHLWNDETKKFALNPNVPVTKDTPPTFIVQAQNDNVDNINNSLVYYIALKDAGVPVEMHLYADGKHAFGLRPTKFPITRWPALVETWLETISIIDRADKDKAAAESPRSSN